MNITDLMQLNSLQNTKILAGHKGMDNKVLNATFIDAPDGYRWCKNGDFIVTTGYPFTRNQDWQHGLMGLLEKLVKKNCSGIGLKLGRYIPDLPIEVISYANENRFPIISLPNHLSWTEVIVPIITQINKQQEHELEMTHKVYEQFHNHLKIKGNLNSLAQLLHSILKIPVTIYIRDFNKIIYTHEYGFSQEEIESIIASQFHEKIKTLQKINIHNKNFTVRWIYSSERLAGGIFLWGFDTTLQVWEKAALEQTAVITALEMERIRTVATTYQHFRNDFLETLLDDTKLEREVILRRGKEVNWDLKDNYKVILLDCNLDNLSENELPIWQKKTSILEEFENELRWILPNTLIGFDSQNRFTLLISDVDDAILIDKLNILVEKVNVTSFYGGIGRLNKVENISSSYKDAILALQVAYANMLNNNKSKGGIQLDIRSFYKLDVERILFSENPRVESINVAKEYLQAILDYDKKRNSELLNTLKTFINHDTNYDTTAATLFVHKNTVRYRINLIKKITGLDPGKMKDLFLLQMAITTLESLPTLE